MIAANSLLLLVASPNSSSFAFTVKLIFAYLNVLHHSSTTNYHRGGSTPFQKRKKLEITQRTFLKTEVMLNLHQMPHPIYYNSYNLLEHSNIPAHSISVNF